MGRARKLKGAGVVSLGIALAGTAYGLAQQESSDSTVTVHAVSQQESSQSGRPAFGKYPRDLNGDGMISDEGDERFPALVSAMGWDDDGSGVAGYVRYDDLWGNTPSTPAEAIAMVDHGPTSVPLYTEDGTTVIGEFRIRRSNG